MNTPPSPPRDYLVLKVAAGVVIGGLILGVIAKFSGVILVNPSMQVVAPPADLPTTAAASPSGLPPAQVVSTPAQPQQAVIEASSKPDEKAKGNAASTAAQPAASVASPAQGEVSKAMEETQDATNPQDQVASNAAAESTPADQPPADASASVKAGTTASKPRKLEPVPDGFRCIEGRLFRVLPNGFEQVTDGSEKRYCL